MASCLLKLGTAQGLNYLIRELSCTRKISSLSDSRHLLQICQQIQTNCTFIALIASAPPFFPNPFPHCFSHPHCFPDCFGINLSQLLTPIHHQWEQWRQMRKDQRLASFLELALRNSQICPQNNIFKGVFKEFLIGSDPQTTHQRSFTPREGKLN